MLRMTLLWMFVAFIGLYAWKDWCKALCAPIFLMGVFEHPDMPKAMFGIPGLNPWNILLCMIIVVAWVSNQRTDANKWDMPSCFNKLLVFYGLLIVIGFFRMLWNFEGLEDYAATVGRALPGGISVWNEYLFNPIKWTIPGLLLFFGCRSLDQFKLGLAAILGAYMLLALQVIKCIPLQTLLADGPGLAEKTIHVLRKDVGYHRTDIAVILASASWAFLAAKDLFKFKGRTIFFIACYLITFLALALTGGRGGYLAWVGTGFFFCWFRYRKFLLLVLLLIPVIVGVATTHTPGLVDRITEGFISEESDEIDQNELTAGRSVAWPLVIDKIIESPIVGYGREAMKHQGIATTLFLDFDDSAPHPHNAYLEIILDNGMFGLIVIAFYLLVLKESLKFFKDKKNVLHVSIGGVCFAIVLSNLIASLTGQTFYPREAVVGMWCAIGLLLRLVANRSSKNNEVMNVTSSKVVVKLPDYR